MNLEYRLGTREQEKIIYYQQIVINYLLQTNNLNLSNLITEYLFEKTVETIYPTEKIRKLKNHLKTFSGSEQELINAVAHFLYEEEQEWG